eukprot:CAMPEP_0194485790 /NCGR_PEP_ID=MMETSP0253-20130528/6668_1 /TAXON_ID=2966 /ORGANISM="Noctiluca scintillans" /LENGTH=256 /DNA_ID=CAMNT_0039325801 /DNA_START=37 /DNA_END=807 /DNA_ORIENTATION=-
MPTPRCLRTDCVDDLDDIHALWCGEDYVRALDLGLKTLPLEEADLDTTVGENSQCFSDSSSPFTEPSFDIFRPGARASASEVCNRLVSSRGLVSNFNWLSAEQLQLAEVIEKIHETNPEVVEDLMAVEDPCTNVVLYIQLCVKGARSMDNPISERRRAKISKELTDDEMWRLDQLSVQFTTCEQRVEVVKALLQTEAKLASLDVTENFGLRFPQFWYFMSKYNICETAVRFRRSLAPPESRRKRVMSTRQASTLSM